MHRMILLAAAATLFGATVQAQPRTSEIVSGNGVTIETYVQGSGPAIVMLPSTGRDGGEDFDDVAARLQAAGFRVLRPLRAGSRAQPGRWRASACTSWRTTWRW